MNLYQFNEFISKAIPNFRTFDYSIAACFSFINLTLQTRQQIFQFQSSQLRWTLESWLINKPMKILYVCKLSLSFSLSSLFLLPFLSNRLSWQHFTAHKVPGNSEKTLSHREVSRYETFIGCRYVHRVVVKDETTLHRITEVCWICLGKLAVKRRERWEYSRG